MGFNADIVRLLESHSAGRKKTYAYTFTELVNLPAEDKPWPNPDWLKVSADHTDELPFVFGLPFIPEHNSVYAGTNIKYHLVCPLRPCDTLVNSPLENLTFSKLRTCLIKL